MSQQTVHHIGEFLSHAFLSITGPAAAYGFVPLPAYERPSPPTVIPIESDDPALRALYEARMAFAAKDHHAALDAFSRAAMFDTDLDVAHYGRAVCLTHLDRPQEAVAALAMAVGNALDATPEHLRFARMAVTDGHPNVALQVLEHAVTQLPGLAYALHNDTTWAPLRDHPRFVEMTRRID